MLELPTTETRLSKTNRASARFGPDNGESAVSLPSLETNKPRISVTEQNYECLVVKLLTRRSN